MTVEEAIEQLSKLPPKMDLYVAERKTDFAYGLVNSIYTKEISFSEDPEGKPLAKDTVVVIDEE